VAPDEEALFGFYEARVGAEVTGGAAFDRWWRRTRQVHPHLLELRAEDLLGGAVADPADYPDVWSSGALELPLSYRFEPGDEADGVTVTIPIGVLNQVRPAEFDWQVPALRLELVTALMRQLPKALRKEFVPIPEHAERVVADLQPLGPAAGPFREVLARRLAHAAGQPIPAGIFTGADLPEHLRMRFEVIGPAGEVLAAGRDLAGLQSALRPRLRATLRHAAGDLERRGQRSWTFGTIPRVLEQATAGPTAPDRAGAGLVALRGYPALVDEGETVGLRVVEGVDEQYRIHWAGTRRLLRLTTASPLRALRPVMGNDVKLAATRCGVALADFIEDCVNATFDHLIEQAGGPVWDEAAFDRLRQQVAATATNLSLRVASDAAAALRLAARLHRRLDALAHPLLATTVADVRQQLADLVHPGFLRTTGLERLADLSRYLQAVERRLDKAERDPHGDVAKLRTVRALEHDFDRIVAQWPPGSHPVEAERLRWLLEELRVATFAQVLGTPEPVSANRLRAALEDLRRSA
jgi:ATP-dependent helicase HrpA